ncbi:hypothetical protein N7528_009425 [Penicillium herquei]|nr:hypothetical protein N7528_009425 [Penicillium herquei]
MTMDLEYSEPSQKVFEIGICDLERSSLTTPQISTTVDEKNFKDFLSKNIKFFRNLQPIADKDRYRLPE